ncbi:MAG: NAD(P)-binding domain-containing protein, partial [Bacteroidota bacterium]
MSSTVSASIVGASGYSGAELLKILSRHNGVSVHKLFANTSSGKRVDEVFPEFRGVTDAAYEPYSAEAACSSDVVFIALPSGEAMAIVPELLQRGKRVIDLGGDFRLKDPALYESFYKHPHRSTELLSKAVYGLPELF